MASGFKVAGVDLDARFMGRVGAARANVGFKVAGTDIANRYEQIGGAAAGAATGFKAAGTDLASLFRSASPFSLTAGFNNPSAGESTTGYSTNTSIGSMSPSSYSGVTIIAMEDLQSVSVPSVAGFRVILLGTHPSTWLTSVTINGVVFPTNIAFFLASGGTSLWRWAGSFAGLANGVVYPVALI